MKSETISSEIKNGIEFRTEKVKCVENDPVVIMKSVYNLQGIYIGP